MDPAVFKRLKRMEGFNHARGLNWSCFQNRAFLKSERACGWVVEAVERARALHGFHVWAWCIMPTHVHLLVFPRPARLGGNGLAPVLKSIKQSVSRRAVLWTREHAPARLALFRDRGTDEASIHRFWQRGGGYDRNLWSDSAVWNEVDYIHRNPVEGGLCVRDSDWGWSSARQYASREDGPIVLDRSKMPGRP